MLAVALSVLLIGAVLAFYRHATGVRQTLLGQIAADSQRRVAMERITVDLRSAMTLPFLGLGLSGGDGAMEFPAATTPGMSVWGYQRLEDAPIPPEADLQIITYRLRYALAESGEPLVDEQGNPVVIGLERICRKTIQQVIIDDPQAPDPTVQTTLLCEGIKFLSLRFWGGDSTDWVETWQAGELPTAVEVVVGAQPLPAGVVPADYPYETHRRVIYLPVGQRSSQSGTTIRGLGQGAGP
jgi:hypothetical protein